MDRIGDVARHCLFQRGGIDPPLGAVDRTEPRSAGKIFRRAALVLDHMRLSVSECNSARTVCRGQGEGVCSRAGRHEKDGHFALEDRVELVLHGTIEFTRAVSRSKTGCMGGEARGDFRMGAGPVV